MKEETEVQDPETQEAEDMPVENEDSEATPEEQADEVAIPKETDKQEKPEPEGKKPYTSEELEEIITSDGQVDSERLTAEGKLLLKSFQRGYGKKFETLAEERRRLQKPEVPADPREAYFQQYLADPVGKIREVNAEIYALKTEASTLRVNGEFEKAEGKDKQVLHLEGFREELSAKRLVHDQQKANEAEFNEAILRAIPDIDDKVDALTKFALEELGYTKEDLFCETNVKSGIPVARAVRNIVNVHRLFAQANAAKTVSKKVKKPFPPTLERGGAGGGGGKAPQEPPKDMAGYIKWREKELAIGK